jgi:aminoglycoside phosphotransferase (APT) family kinase protein
MEWVEGDTLAFVWSRNLLSTEEKQAIVRQVAGYINQLRSLEPPQKEIVASAELGPCLDGRVGYRVFGPFTNHEEFHSLLRGHISLENSVQSFGEAVPRIHTRQYRTCFSHADLGTGNLIVRDRKIVAVIDWQFAGWYPEYWEYTKAHYGLYNMPDWYSGFENAVTRYDNELAAEMALWERLDQPGVELEIAAQLRLERQAALPQIISTSPARSD